MSKDKDEAAAPAPDPTMKRIADALEDLVALISALEHLAARELRARRVSPEEPDEEPAAK